MSSVQRFFARIFPKSWVESMEKESRNWMTRCGECGFEKSVWDSGGIRWKAAGSPRRYMNCSSCGQSGWHTVYYKTTEGKAS